MKGAIFLFDPAICNKVWLKKKKKKKIKKSRKTNGIKKFGWDFVHAQGISFNVKHLCQRDKRAI